MTAQGALIDVIENDTLCSFGSLWESPLIDGYVTCGKTEFVIPRQLGRLTSFSRNLDKYQPTYFRVSLEDEIKGDCISFSLSDISSYTRQSVTDLFDHTFFYEVKSFPLTTDIVVLVGNVVDEAWCPDRTDYYSFYPLSTEEGYLIVVVGKPFQTLPLLESRLNLRETAQKTGAKQLIEKCEALGIDANIQEINYFDFHFSARK